MNVPINIPIFSVAYSFNAIEFVAKLIENASSSASKAPFEAIVILESVLYHSPSGQEYYTLQVFDARSDGES